VVDRGIGIPAEDQARIFQRFFRAQNASTNHYGGLGLGLFISHGVVSLHGGEMSVSSDEGEGAAFTVTLPRMRGPELRRMPRWLLYLDDVAQPNAVASLRDAGFQLVRERGAEALRNLVMQPLEAVVVGPGTAPSAAKMLCEAVRTAPLARPLPWVWLGERPEWAEPAQAPKVSRALEQALRRSVSVRAPRR
jgi:hypothetical protein